VGAIDVAHAALTQRRDDFIGTESGTRRQCQD
jgi:hypothetical protein